MSTRPNRLPWRLVGAVIGWARCWADPELRELILRSERRRREGGR